MTWIRPGLTIALAVTLAVVGIFTYLWRRDRAPFLLHLVIAWAANAVRFGVLLAATAMPSPVWAAADRVLTLVTAYFLLAGLLGLVGVRIATIWAPAVGIVAAWTGLATLLDLDVRLTLSGASGLFLVGGIAGGWRVASSGPEWGPWRQPAGAALALLGLERALAPHLAGFAESPWSGVGSSLLAGTLIVATILVYQHRLRAELASSEARYGRLVDTLPDIVYRIRLDPEPELAFVSHAIERVTGFAPDELAGPITRVEERLEPGDIERVREALRTTEPLRDPLVVRFRARDGQVRLLELVHTPVAGPDGTIVEVDGVARDVTERSETTEALRRSEALLRGILDHADAVIYVKDLEGRYLHANRAFLGAFGRTLAETVGHTDYDFTTPEEADRFRLSDRTALEAGMAIRSDEPGPQPDDPRTFLSVKFPLRDDRGVPFAIAGIATEITERVTATKAVEASQRMLQRVMDNVPQLVWWKDRDLRYLGCNEPFARHLGLPPREIVGRTDAELPWPLEEAAAIVQAEQRVLREDRARYHIVAESRGARPDGRALWLDLNRIPLHDADGLVTGLLGTAEDITERRESQERLRSILGLQQAILDGATYAILSCTPDGIIRTFNAAAERLTGYPAEEVIGRTTPLLFHDPEEIRRRAAELSDEFGEPVAPSFEAIVSRARRGVPDEREWSCVRKDGSRFPVLLSVTALRDEEGRTTGFVAIGNDLSGRRRLEEQLLQAQKMEAIGRLAGGVAHDFNNLLTAILGYADLLQSTLPPESTQREDLDEIRRAAERASNLTRQLLSFARRQMIAPEEVDLNALVVQTDRLLRRLIGEHIDLVTLPGDDLARVRIDPGQFEQILVNLAVNARDAMTGGGKLTIETRNVTLDEEMARQRADIVPGPYVLLAVSDTGTGIDPETMHHIFEPFFTTKGAGEGVGLGLATCYGIVKQAGGHIFAYSEPGLGTTFKIYLPAIRGGAPQPRDAAPPSQAPRTTRGTETILLVEDEPLVRAMGLRALRDQGYRVLEAGSGAEALALAARHTGPIDLLVTDVVMPGMSGPEVVETLRASMPDLRVLFVSGYAEDMIVRHQVLEAGLQFLPKPFTPGSLTRRVRDLLDS